MITKEMNPLFQPHGLSHFKWKGNFFNFSRTPAWRGFSILMQVIRIKNTICLPHRKKRLWATETDGLGMLQVLPQLHVSEIQGSLCSLVLTVLFSGIKIWFKRETPNFLLIFSDLEKNLISTLQLLEFWPRSIKVLVQKNWILEARIQIHFHLLCTRFMREKRIKTYWVPNMYPICAK